MDDSFFNPNPQIESFSFDNGEACYVIDDALREPERLRQWAIEQRDDFKDLDFTAYPGTYLLPPQALGEALHTYFQSHIRQRFDVQRVLQMQSRLAMVTCQPAELKPFQRLCHIDQMGLPSIYSIQASVLYLFDDPALGGTSFYVPTRSDVETIELFRDATSLPTEQFNRRYDIAPGYMNGSNRYFRRIGQVPARWNRMIFYDANILHTGDITDPSRLSKDPSQGRLTFIGFFTSQRHTV
ncbi:DUF6445 family protein [Oleiagrimonas sp.]|jgi:hypothetical protein|uniref:DUF6445 family protein n=1 Tax=Oleiagrimonas sp. TaxID=2010330 RepID=UPI0026116AAF|nr:DUF6445 family protein [Oleiagrimonas sp.]MDA3913139.1 DUF6445 family protein [Oleiagrimonas sp.]